MKVPRSLLAVYVYHQIIANLFANRGFARSAAFELATARDLVLVQQ